MRVNHRHVNVQIKTADFTRRPEAAQVDRFVGGRYQGYQNVELIRIRRGLGRLLPKRRDYKAQITIEGFPFLLERKASRFKLMGKTMPRNEALTILSRAIIWSSISLKKGGDVFLYVNRYLEIPSIIRKAIDERISFTFYEMEDSTLPRSALSAHEKFHGAKPYQVRRTHTVLLNVERIGDKLYAIELSDNVWGQIRESQLIKFTTICNGRQNVRSEWWNITPEKLWHKLMGESPTKSQLKTMTQFLKHNRKSKLVEDASLELVKNLMNNKNMRVNFDGTKISVLVKGSKGYYLIQGSRVGTVTGGLQDASTQTITEGRHWAEFSGRSMCIDNTYSGSSIGDQIYTRAMVCLNDANNNFARPTHFSKSDFKLKFDTIPNVWPK